MSKAQTTVSSKMVSRNDEKPRDAPYLKTKPGNIACRFAWKRSFGTELWCSLVQASCYNRRFSVPSSRRAGFALDPFPGQNNSGVEMKLESAMSSRIPNRIRRPQTPSASHQRAESASLRGHLLSQVNPQGRGNANSLIFADQSCASNHVCKSAAAVVLPQMS